MDTETKRSRTITWADPLLIPKATAGKSGLEALREVFEGRVPPPPIAETMGIEGVHVEEGKAVFEGEPEAVESLVRLCREGPRGAEVERVDVFEEEPEGLARFDVG